MLFLFDYGDEWHFIVELKGIELPKEGEQYPLVVKSEEVFLFNMGKRTKQNNYIIEKIIHALPVQTGTNACDTFHPQSSIPKYGSYY